MDHPDVSLFFMKCMAWNEKTASTGLLVRLTKRYSTAATGRLEASASPGMKGLQPVASTATGMAGSWRATVPKGKRVVNDALAKRGKP